MRTLMRVINKIVFITSESIYFKYLNSGPKFEPKISNDMGPHICISLFGLYPPPPPLFLNVPVYVAPFLIDNTVPHEEDV